MIMTRAGRIYYDARSSQQYLLLQAYRWQEDLHMPLSDLFFSILFYHTRCPEMSHPHRLTGTAEGGQTS